MWRRITFSIPWPLTAAETREIFSFAFQTALTSYLLFYLLENLKPGFIASFFDLDILMWSTIGIGTLSTIWPMMVSGSYGLKKDRQKMADFVWLTLLSGGTIAVVWLKVSSIGWLVNIIAPISGLVVFGFCLMVFYGRDDESISPSKQ